MKFCQLVHTLSYGDAISGEVIALDRFFTSLGHESSIYAINVHPKYKSIGKTIDLLPQTFDGEVILHYSLGSPLNDIYLDLTRSQKTLIYHNLTPAKWFWNINPGIAKDINKGLEELPKLCENSDRLISDSSFNAQELENLGFNSVVLNLPYDDNRWIEPENEGIAKLLSNAGGLTILHVGRLAPNKCIEDIIKTFYFIHHHAEKNSRLWLVGIDIDTELYSFALKRLVHELKLSDSVVFAGCLSDAELKAAYKNSSAYICMSEHEGFCLPIVEAMSFNLPVFAYASSAVYETVGDGGILFNKKLYPEIAELVVKVCNDKNLYETQKSAGKRRLSAFSVQKFNENLVALFPHLGS